MLVEIKPWIFFSHCLFQHTFFIYTVGKVINHHKLFGISV